MTLKNYIKNMRKKGFHSFTITQAASDLHVSRNNLTAAAYRLKKRGDIMTPSRGFYVIVPPEYQFQGSIPAPELTPIFMKHLKADYYVSLLSAAQYYGASHQKPGCFQIITNKRIKHSLQFGPITLEIIYKKSLANLPTRSIVVSTGYLKIATPELIVFDLLSYPIRSGGLNHIATVLSELINVIDSKKLIQFAQQIKEKAWLQRLGFIFEQLDPIDKEKTMTLIKDLELYLKGIPKTFVPLATELPQKGFVRIKKWHIIANTSIESDL